MVTLRSGGGGSPVDLAGFGSLGLQCLASADSAADSCRVDPTQLCFAVDRAGENHGVGTQMSRITLGSFSIFPFLYSAHTVASDSWTAPRIDRGAENIQRYDYDDDVPVQSMLMRSM